MEPSQTTEKHLILIVDDEPRNIQLLGNMLKQNNYEIEFATSGNEALEWVKSESFNLILLDVMMEGINGFETAQLLKKNTDTKEIPIIFMTALSDIDSKIAGFSAGAVDYITKPIQQEEVLARIATHLSISDLQNKLQAKNLKLQEEIAVRKRVEAELHEANLELQRQARIDALTQVANRRRFDEYVEEVWLQKMRQQRELSLIMIDIDHFKKYNDTYGHQAGDECLKQVANAIDSSVKRAGEMVARYGGEEFVVLLPDSGKEDLNKLAQKINAEVLNLKIPHSQSDTHEYVSLSLGCSCTTPKRGMKIKQFISFVDEALYEAKAQGRNRSVFKAYLSEL